MAGKPQSLGTIIVEGLGGLLFLIVLVYAVMYFMKPQRLPQSTDTLEISFEPKEIKLDRAYALRFARTIPALQDFFEKVGVIGGGQALAGQALLAGVPLQ